MRVIWWILGAFGDLVIAMYVLCWVIGPGSGIELD